MYELEKVGRAQQAQHILVSFKMGRWDAVCRSALEMYGLELAFMVISHSQRDPGEYMLQLQQVAAQPEGPLRRHAIDVHLGRWRHALSDLLQAGLAHFEQALALATDKARIRPAILIVASVAFVTAAARIKASSLLRKMCPCPGLQSEFVGQVPPHTDKLCTIIAEWQATCAGLAARAVV